MNYLFSYHSIYTYHVFSLQKQVWISVELLCKQVTNTLVTKSFKGRYCSRLPFRPIFVSLFYFGFVLFFFPFSLLMTVYLWEFNIHLSPVTSMSLVVFTITLKTCLININFMKQNNVKLLVISIICKFSKNSRLVWVQIMEAIINTITIKKLLWEGEKLPCPL